MKQRSTGISTLKKSISIAACICLSAASFAGQGEKANNKHNEDKTLKFIENKGQWIAEARYMANLNGGTVFLTNAGFVYDYYDQAKFEEIAEDLHHGKSAADMTLAHHAFKVNFVNANQDIRYKADSKFQTYYNYFIGSDSTKWAGKVGLFGKVCMNNVYDGIDVAVYSNGPDLKYDFNVQPGADPSLIQLAYEGISPALTPDGHLLIKTSVNEFKEMAPFTYQIVNGKQKVIASKYYLKGNQVSFQLLEDYDRSIPLIIDPQLKYATYSGAPNGAFLSMGTTYDAAGSLYAVADVAASATAWPTTTGAYLTTIATAGTWQYNAINKYSIDGSTLIYSTYIGCLTTTTQNPSSVHTNAMATTAQNELVITGSVKGTGYPVTAGAYDQTLDGTTDIFVTKFSADGSTILQSTFVGGSGTEAGIASELTNPTNVVYSPSQTNAAGGSVLNGVDVQIDNAGNVWVASNSASSNFPVTANAFQATDHGGSCDGVLFCLSPNLSTLVYSTYYGGSGLDILEGISIMPNGNIAVSGFTTSTNLATTTGSLHPTFLGGTSDGFAGILNPVTGTLSASTYLGTTGQDNAARIQANVNNEIYVLGRTNGNYPVSAGTYNIPNGMLFIDKLNSTLTASLASTRTGFPVGGINGCNPSAFLVDKCGTVYLSCVGVLTSTASTFPVMPLTPDALATTPRNFWCATLSGDLSTLKYATYYGSAATGANMDHQHQGTNHFDPKGILYQSICARVNNNLGTPGSWSQNMQNSAGTSPNDPFSFKIDFQFFVHADFSVDPSTNGGRDTGCAPLELTFTNNSTDSISYIWDFGDGSPVSNASEPTHVFQAGEYDVKLIAVNNSPSLLCVNSDTAILHVVAIQRSKPFVSLNDTILCLNDPINVTATTSGTTVHTTYQWSPAAAIISGNGTTNVTIDPTVSTNITLTAANGTGECDSATSADMHITVSGIANARVIPNDTSICPGDTIMLRAFRGTAYEWSPFYAISAIDTDVVSVWPFDDITYTVSISDTNNCKADLISHIHVWENLDVDAGRDIDVKYGESVFLDGRAPYDFFWQPDVYPSNTLRPEVKPLATTTYYLTGHTNQGCLVTDSVTVYVTFANMPNAFSPNGDGLNDIFSIMPNNDHFKLLNFSVYDRWGKRVFYTEDVTEGWNGTLNDKPADMGTYYYYVVYAIGGKNYTFKGDVTLIR